MLTPVFTSVRFIFLFTPFIFAIYSAFEPHSSALAADSKTRTIVADLLMVDGDFYIVRGERGEIQIEVTPDTKLSEKFAFGDRIKAVVLPNDVAQSITRATPDDPTGITTNEPSSEPSPHSGSTETATETKKTDETDPIPSAAPTHKIPDVRIVVADLLMVDGSFYIVRDAEYGEIQIEITPETELSENFQFGDKIKARITSTDKALSVVRAGKDEPEGIQDEAAPVAPPIAQSSAPASPSAQPPVPTPPITASAPPEKKVPDLPVETPSLRTIVADVLMLDGDFYIVRGERGEIRIEVTPKTTISEEFGYGDRIKAEVLPNDKALKIERASPDDPIGITPN